MSTPKILIVDDSGVQRKMIIQIIKKAGFDNEVLEAEDGVKAIAMLGANFQDIGLVLCDWNMPNMSGLGVIKEVAKVEYIKNIPIVMVTTEGSEKKVQEAKAANPNLAGYVTKPFTPLQLKIAIDPILSKAG